MLSNETYRFIFVSLTLREGKRGVSVSYVPSEVNRSNDKSTYQFCVVLHWCSTTRETSYWINWEERNCAFSVNKLVVSCLSTKVIKVPNWWLHYLEHAFSILRRRNVSNPQYFSLLRKFSLTYALLRFFFSWSRQYWSSKRPTEHQMFMTVATTAGQ